MNVAMRLLEKKKELPKKEKFLKKSLLEAQKNLTDAYAGMDSDAGAMTLIRTVTLSIWTPAYLQLIAYFARE